LLGALVIVAFVAGTVALHRSGVLGWWATTCAGWWMQVRDWAF
jgi:hypothetical protein